MPVFTPQQTARGLATTIARGDYSLSVSRLATIKRDKQQDVLRCLRSELDALTWITFCRYLSRYNITPPSD